MSFFPLIIIVEKLLIALFSSDNAVGKAHCFSSRTKTDFFYLLLLADEMLFSDDWIIYVYAYFSNVARWAAYFLLFVPHSCIDRAIELQLTMLLVCDRGDEWIMFISDNIEHYIYRFSYGSKAIIVVLCIGGGVRIRGYDVEILWLNFSLPATFGSSLRKVFNFKCTFTINYF